MSREDWIWMPHAAHFICGYRCMFRLATYVNGVIISTVGEQVDSWSDYDKGIFQDVGFERKYEAMVFKAKKSGNRCCPYRIVDPGNPLDFRAYKSNGMAMRGHYLLCEKWDKIGVQ